MFLLQGASKNGFVNLFILAQEGFTNNEPICEIDPPFKNAAKEFAINVKKVVGV
ncbi:hypothetical protein ACNVED_16045 (plasmid) [Legionella sp. D16C41]|uniref:hypothetical protein n=1 Tax=Legionella sp. D16C41 TaxID=3402688 RepID=UPI003AF49EF4